MGWGRAPGPDAVEPPAVTPPRSRRRRTPPQIGGYLRNGSNWANVLEIVPARLLGTKPQAFELRAEVWGSMVQLHVQFASQAFTGRQGMPCGIIQDSPKPSPCPQKTQSSRTGETAFACVERAMGVEPTSVAWEATVLPMNYARVEADFSTESRSPSVY